MCGARRPHKQSRAAWFFIFFLLLLTMSQGHQELVRVKEDSYSSPMSGGGGEEQLSRMGSNPPCTAVLRVRAAAGRLGPQCSNYQPVGWKCKCGAAVFDP